jgi:hypothetical protein
MSSGDFLLILSVYQNRGFGQTVETATITMPKKLNTAG